MSGFEGTRRQTRDERPACGEHSCRPKINPATDNMVFCCLRMQGALSKKKQRYGTCRASGRAAIVLWAWNRDHGHLFPGAPPSRCGVLGNAPARASDHHCCWRLAPRPPLAAAPLHLSCHSLHHRQSLWGDKATWVRPVLWCSRHHACFEAVSGCDAKEGFPSVWESATSFGRSDVRLSNSSWDKLDSDYRARLASTSIGVCCRSCPMLD